MSDWKVREMTIEDYEGVKKLWLSIKGFAIRSIDDSYEGVEKFLKIGINDVFGQSGKPADLLREYELTGPQIADKILKSL